MHDGFRPVTTQRKPLLIPLPAPVGPQVRGLSTFKRLRGWFALVTGSIRVGRFCGLKRTRHRVRDERAPFLVHIKLLPDEILYRFRLSLCHHVRIVQPGDQRCTCPNVWTGSGALAPIRCRIDGGTD